MRITLINILNTDMPRMRMFWINFKADVDIIDCETKQNPPRETKYCVTNILII